MIVFTMEHSKEFYESIIRVIDHLNPYSKDVWNVTPEKGQELAGDYWPEIGRMFKEDLKLGWFEYGQFRINNRPQLAPLRKDCEHAIEKIDKAERDRKLNNRGIKVAMWCAILGIIISIVSFIWTIRTDNRLDEMEDRVLKLEQVVFPRQLNHNIPQQ